MIYNLKLLHNASITITSDFFILKMSDQQWLIFSVQDMALHRHLITLQAGMCVMNS